MNTKNTVFSRLFDADKHRELKLKAVKKVDLSIKSDLEDAISTLSEYDVAQANFDEVVSIAKNFNSLLEQIRPLAREFKNAYGDLRDSNDTLEQDTNNFKEKIFEYQNALRDLGLDDLSDDVRNYYDILNKYEVLDSLIYNYNYEQDKLVGVDFTSLLSWANDIED